VSGRALIVAACRAVENKRGDGLVREVFAERLAGERGMVITRSMPILEITSSIVAMRVRFMDRFIIETVRRGRICS
jgi:O-methyltransferase involved in polyketide biosynthesis